ncbi:hypothetical protein H0H92_014026 [Tricholoma furcatifolium]|nr:hypothetical protein H0H92_014026 [Tricholoma furcatifolium]
MGEYKPLGLLHVALLVESGAVFAVLQLFIDIFTIAVNPQNERATFVYNIFDVIYYFFAMVYPALTIFLINGPFSIAGIHDSIVQIQLSLNEQESQRLQGNADALPA